MLVSGRMTPLPAGLKPKVFATNEREGDWIFIELIRSLMRLANQARSDTSNAVRAAISLTDKFWTTAITVVFQSIHLTKVWLAECFRLAAAVNLSWWRLVMRTMPARPRTGVSLTWAYHVRRQVLGCAGFEGSRSTSVTLSNAEKRYGSTVDTISRRLFSRSSSWSFILAGWGSPCFRAFSDEDGAIQLAKDPAHTSNAKHIDTGHH